LLLKLLILKKFNAIKQEHLKCHATLGDLMLSVSFDKTMTKRDIENLLFQVLQEKQTKAHPCLEYLTKRLCCLYFLQCSTFSGGDVVTGGDKDKTNRLEEKYKACCEIYKEFTSSKYH
jgi:hypothetical protein